MTTYSIEIVDAQGVEQASIPMQGVRTDNGAVRRLRSFLEMVAPYDYPGMRIYLHFYRATEQVAGYLNPDGADLTGRAWA